MATIAETWIGSIIMESYPVPQFKAIEDVQQWCNIVREFRQRDITMDKTYQAALVQLGYKHPTITTITNLSIGPTNLSVDVDVTAAGRTITLIASPTDGQMHIVTKADASANNVTVSGNGKNINGAGTVAWNTQYQGRLLIYMAGSGEWRALTL